MAPTSVLREVKPNGFFDKLRDSLTVDEFTGYLGQYFGEEEMSLEERTRFNEFLYRIYDIAVRDMNER